MQNGIFMPKISINTGNQVKSQSVRNFYCLMLIGLLICFSVSTHALDNPDASDYVGDFLNRTQVYELDIQRTTHTTQSYITAYAAYEQFLDQELNNTYNQLMAHLNDEAQQVLRDSQRQWLKYRNAEFSFIAHNWTTKNFGSASALSRGDYRTKLIKNRVVILLRYLQNY